MWPGIDKYDQVLTTVNVIRYWQMWPGIDKYDQVLTFVNVIRQIECDPVLTNTNVIRYWQIWSGIDKCDPVMTNVIWYWDPVLTNVTRIYKCECGIGKWIDPLMVVVHLDRYCKINPHESKLKWSILCLLWSKVNILLIK